MLGDVGTRLLAHIDVSQVRFGTLIIHRHSMITHLYDPATTAFQFVKPPEQSVVISVPVAAITFSSPLLTVTVTLPVCPLKGTAK